MLRIMLVDDMDIVRRELKRLRIWGEATGFVISHEASNGQEALEMLKSNPVDLVITDIRMPKVDGIELLKEITEKKLCPCVVLLSDYSEFKYARQGLVLGAFDYIVKPVVEEELEELLHRAREYILGKKLEQQRIVQLEQRLEEKVGAYFPQPEVKQLADAINTGDARGIEHAVHIFETVCTNLDYDSIKVVSLLNSIMHEITNGMSESCNWLKKFIDVTELEAIDFSKAKDLYSIKIEFVSTVKKVLYLMQRLRYSTKESGIVNQVSEFVLENIDEDISLKTVSESLYMNKSYVSEAFKQKTGISFTEYLTIVKMERAKKLIGDGRLKTYEVAELLGFKDIEYFSRLFKKSTGLTPTQYRQSTARI